MAGIDANSLIEIRSRIDLADLIGSYGVDLHRAGSNYKACCPFHNEKTPSFIVSPDKGYYHCFGCGERGDIFNFVMKYEGILFTEAVRKLADRAGVRLEEKYDPQAKLRARLYQINQELAAFYRRCLLQTQEGAEARAYLEQRDLTGDIAERFGIGYAPQRKGVLLEWGKRHGFSPDELVAAGVLAAPRRPGDDYYDRFRGRITFPICDVQGRVIAFSCRLLRENKHTGKYVNSPETEIFKKSNTLYALHLARANIAKASPRRALVCEGQVDVIRCHASGFAVAVASQGTAFTETHVALLKRTADTADLVFDGDKAGVKAALRTMALFLAAGMPVRIVSLPADEDPDSLLRTKGAATFQACLDAAEDPAPYLVRRLREQESNPDAMDATLRIAKAAVTTVIDCPEPVLTARFLQDAAEALRLPLSTLEADLESLREDAAEAQRRREAFLMRQQEERPAPTPSSPTQGPTISTQTEETYLDTTGDFVADDAGTEEPYYPEDFGEPAPTQSITDIEASQNLAGALCELLAHHFTDQAVMGCLLRHLPPHFVHNPFAAKFYDLSIAASLNHSATLAPPHDDTEFCDYCARIFALPDRLAAADNDITPLSYAQDLVRQYWLREYERRALLCEPETHEAFQLAQSRKRLQSLSWEAAAPYMDALDPKLLTLTPPTSTPQKPTPASETAEPSPAATDVYPEENDVQLDVFEPSFDDAGDLYDTL